MQEKNTILITGASGFTGYSLFKSFSNFDSIGVYHKHVPEFGVVRCCDMTKKKEVKKLIEEINPKTVIHLAALPGPAINEKHKDIARKLNVDITENLTYNLDKNVHFIFSSTDKVFDGTHPYPDENTPTSPKSFHGHLKYQLWHYL